MRTFNGDKPISGEGIENRDHPLGVLTVNCADDGFHKFTPFLSGLYSREAERRKNSWRGYLLATPRKILL